MGLDERFDEMELGLLGPPSEVALVDRVAARERDLRANGAGCPLCARAKSLHEYFIDFILNVPVLK